MMLNIFFKRIVFYSIALIMLGVAFGAQAENKIDVEYLAGNNLNGDKIFNEENIYPGWSQTEIIRVKNSSETDDVNLYFNFDVKGDKTLASKLKLYVIRVADGSYRIGGSGDHYTLRKADDENLYADKLSATKGKEYKVKIKFDEDAGNEYQGLEAKFNIDFAIESEEAGAETEAEILSSEGRVVTGEAPEEEAGIEAEVAGEETSENAEGIVAGEEVICQSWPWWSWALILLAYAILFNFNNFYGEQEKEKKIRWFWEAFYTGAVLVIWYFFDECREHIWFVIAVVIGGALSYGYYLQNRNKSDKMEKVK